MFFAAYLLWWQFRFRGIIDIDTILKTVGVITGSVAAIGTLAKYTIDRDNDGISDVIEKEIKQQGEHKSR